MHINKIQPKQFYKYSTILWFTLMMIVSSISFSQKTSIDKLGIDKIAHFTEYFILSVLLYKSLFYHNMKFYKIFFLMLIISIALPIADEYHQLLIPGRSFSYFDMLADFIGFFTPIAFILFKRVHKKTWKTSKLEY